MRFYSFVNGLYMNSLQYGLQSGHAVGELSVTGLPMYDEWAIKHKTMIILDATNLAGLKRVYRLLNVLIPLYNSFEQDDARKIPYGCFREDEDSLGGIMTCVALIVPEHIYDGEFDLVSPEDGKPIKPRDVIEGFEASIAEGRTWTKYGIELLIHCLLKSYNLAPR